ncbi:MAG: hypothetical protein AAF498_09520 [Pseudomonadota bacterium]
MAKRSEALIRAQKKYDAKRQKKSVLIRLDDDDMKRLDKARGKKSRAAYVEEATMDKLDKDKA